MILLKNEKTGFVITLDDTNDDGFIVGATDELRDELQNDQDILESMITQRARVIAVYIERAEQSPSTPTIERQVAARLVAEGYEVVSEVEVDRIDDGEEGVVDY